MSAWHGIYADVLRQRFSALAAYGVVLTGDRAEGLALAQRATEAVFSRARAPHSIAQAEQDARREMVRMLAADAGAGWGAARGEGGPWAPADESGVRGWLASLSPLERAAAALYAVDGLDDAGMRRALGRPAWGGPSRAGGVLATPIPDARAAQLRDLYAEEAARHAEPHGGATGTIAASRGRRRESLIRRGVLTGAAAVAVVAVGVGAAHAIDLAGPDAAPAPTASLETVTVTWDPGAELEAAMAGLVLPQCGDTWMPGPQAVNGVTPLAVGAEVFFAGEPDSFHVTQAFDHGSAEPVPLLYMPGLMVVTLDDTVVYADDPRAEWIHDARFVQYASPTGKDFVGPMWRDRADFCDAHAAWDEQGLGAVDWDSLSPAEQLELGEAADLFRTVWNTFKPGTYRVYSVTPMMFGEQAALAHELMGLGLRDLNDLHGTLRAAAFTEDPRLAPYCGPVDQGGGYLAVECNPPESALREVLTRQVDRAAIMDWAPGVGISEPLIAVVP